MASGTTTNQPQTLAGKTAVITGGNSGIGLASAKRLSAAGAFVFIVGRNQESLDDAVKLLGGASKAIGVRADVAVVDEIDRIYAAVKDSGRRVDVVVANAGVVEHVPTTDVDVAHYDRISNVNARGAYFTVQKSLPLLNDGASILIVGSAIHLKGFPANSVYAATKAAVRSFVRTWTAELKDRKIRANLISPGPVATPMFDNLAGSPERKAALEQQFSAMVPAGRLAHADEIAAAVYYLASDESSYVYGADLVVDGGVSAV